MDIFPQAYLFKDYWEDIGTIKSFFDANLALAEQVSRFFLITVFSSYSSMLDIKYKITMVN